VHSFVINSYPERFFRNPEAGKNEGIKLVSMICSLARTLGLQYTKRFLPDFLVTGCVIRLDGTLIAMKSGITTPKLIDEACLHMGCVDSRTVKRHVALATASVFKANLHLSQDIARSPEIWDTPHLLPDKSPQESFQQLLDAFKNGLGKMGKPQKFLTELGVIHLFWSGKLNPSTCVSPSSVGPAKSVDYGGQSP